MTQRQVNVSRRSAAKTEGHRSTVEGQADGVSVGLFCAVEAYLRQRHGGVDVRVDAATVNRWIQLLGQVEREYVAIARTESSEERP